MDNEKYIPAIRTDILGDVVKENGNEYVVMFDPKGYAQQPLSFSSEILPILKIFNQPVTVEFLETKMVELYSENYQSAMNDVLELIYTLDYLYYLDSPRFRMFKDEVDIYLKSDIRPAVCAGHSYSDNRQELELFLTDLSDSFSVDDVKPNAEMIIVPHIDLSLKKESHHVYASAYHALRGSEPDLFVIFGTSHYGFSGKFMFTRKNFSTPLGIVKNNNKIIDELLSQNTEGVVIDELAHRHEHSIEFQVLLLQHFFKSREFEILPILVGSFHEFVINKSLPDSNNGFNQFTENLRKIISNSGKKAAFISSVDFSHIGRKFDDDYDADTYLDELKISDYELIHHLANCDADSFFNSVSNVKDKNKICGLSPIYSMLKTKIPLQSRFLSYSQWNDKANNSAVSFASIAYY